jgi:hypothetical protein
MMQGLCKFFHRDIPVVTILTVVNVVALLGCYHGWLLLLWFVAVLLGFVVLLIAVILL